MNPLFNEVEWVDLCSLSQQMVIKTTHYMLAQVEQGHSQDSLQASRELGF